MNHTERPKMRSALIKNPALIFAERTDPHLYRKDQQICINKFLKGKKLQLNILSDENLMGRDFAVGNLAALKELAGTVQMRNHACQQGEEDCMQGASRAHA